MTIMSDDAGTQIIEWMNMSHFLTFHKAISNELACQLLQEEDEMGRECDVVHFHSKHSKSIKITHKYHSITWTTLIERSKVRNHIDKLVPIHLVSTFPPFPEMHLLIQPMQFSIHSLHDVTNTLNNPINLFMVFQQKAKHFGTLEMDKNVNNSVCRLPSFLFMVSIDSSRLSLSIGMFVDQKLSY